MYTLHNARDFTVSLNDEFETVLGSAIERGSFDSLIFLVPTGRRVRLLTRTAVRSLCRKSNLPAGELPIFTLERFVQLCAKQLMGARCPRVLSDAYRLALMEEAAEKADLRFFKGSQNALSPAALERLATVIYGLKEDGVTPNSLRDDIRRADMGQVDRREDIDTARLADIAALYETYELLLGRTLADYPRLLQIVIQVLSGERDPLTMERIDVPDIHPLSIMERWEQLFPGKQALLLDGFSEFKKPEEEFLALLVHAPFHVRIYLDYSRANGPLFANLDETLDNLQNVGFRVHAPEEDIEKQREYQPKKHAPLVSYLRRWLFNTEKDIRHEGFGDMIRVLGVESRVEEARAITRLVKHLSIREDIPLADIAIVMRQPALYSSLFREMCALYNVPANVSDRYPLDKSPVVVAVFAVLDIILLGFRRGDVHRALQSPYIRCVRREKGEEIAVDAANLYEVAMRLRINGGERFGAADGWFERLDKRLDYVRNRLALLAGDVLADVDEVRQMQREVESIERARKDFEALVHLLPRPGRLQPMDFARVLQEQLLERLRVRESIEEFHRTTKRYTDNTGIGYVQLQEEVEKDARALSTFIGLVDELAFVFEERSPGREWPLQEYVDRLRTATRAQRYTTREKTGYGVTITSIEQIRNIPYRVTVLCGAVDGEFPVAYVPESFLGKELPSSEDRFLKRERLQFFQAITNAPRAFEHGEKRVYITYPLYRGNEDVVRSSFVDALLKVVPIKEANCDINLVELQRERLYTEQQETPQWNFVQWSEALGNDEELISEVGQRIALADGSNNALQVFAPVLTEEHHSEVGRIGQCIVQSLHPSDAAASILVRDNLIPEAYASLQKYEHKPYSVTELENYIHCSFRFFANRVLLLREKEEYDTSLSPLEQGNFLHKILYRFYRALQEEALHSGEEPLVVSPHGIPPVVAVRLIPEEKERYRSLLLSIANEEIEHFHFDHVFFELDREKLLGADGRPGRLELWLREELKRIESGWNFVPILFEFGFGSRTGQDRRMSLPPVKLGDGVVLRGKIDRVEIDADGSGEFLIADYKTGRLVTLPGNNDIRKGLALQMPLYAAAAQHLLSNIYGLDAETGGAVYYTLTPERDKAGEIVSHKFVLLPRDSFLGYSRARRTSETVAGSEEKQRLIDNAIVMAQTAKDGIIDGRFPVEPVDRATTCAFCSLYPTCRIRAITAE